MRRKYIDLSQRDDAELISYASDILASENFRKSDNNIQHGSVSVKEHSIDVARESLKINRLLHVNCDKKDLIRGALLHDYFLYDWHIPDPKHERKLHGFYHPGIALYNASCEYDLDNREKDIIRKHMWPLTVIPPTCRESWVVTTADKICSLRETLHMRTGHFKEKV